jgi:Carboxypeptidase regulatory-like domain
VHTIFFATMNRFLLFGLALCVGASALAQAPGGIAGKFLDENGALVPGLDATLALTNTATGAKVSAKLPTDGTYAINNLSPGTYDLAIPIACCMYRTYEQKGLTIAAGKTLALDLHLAWGINLGTIGDDPGMLGNDMRAKAKNIAGPAPRLSNGKPDFSGMWYNVPPPTGYGRPQMKPWAAEMFAQLQKLAPDQQNAASYCLPQHAIPTTLPFPYKLVHTPEIIIHMVEFMTPGFRQVFLDGRPHPEDWNPAWMGHSTGKWDGDTLVIDTVGFNEITPGFGVHSEKLHVVERFRRPDKGHLEVDVTADDAEAFTAPYTFSIRAELVPEEEILEFVCPENNKDPLHFGGLGWKGRP